MRRKHYAINHYVYNLLVISRDILKQVYEYKFKSYHYVIIKYIRFSLDTMIS